MLIFMEAWTKDRFQPVTCEATLETILCVRAHLREILTEFGILVGLNELFLN
jgi:hypothetical protein